jgi:hypothetical protein
MAEEPVRPGIKVIRFPPGTPDVLPAVSPDQIANLTSMPWTLARTEDGGHRVIIVSRRRHRYRIVGVAVDATEDAVTVALLAEHIEGPPRYRTLSKVLQAFSVLLKEPLGGRNLIHAPTPDWPDQNESTEPV